MTDSQPLNQDSPAVQAHLTMMQGVINRMAENSRSCKVWCITLVAAVLVLIARTGEPQHALIALVPTVLFLFLDSYYLALERAFIKSQNAFVAKLHSGELEHADVYRVDRTGIGILPVVGRLKSASIWLFYPLVVVTVVLTWQLILPSATPVEAMP